MAKEHDLPLFVETTIPIWQHTAPKAVRQRIREILHQRTPISSTYVKAEYINAYLRAAVLVHNVVVDSEDLSEAYSRWMKHWGSECKLGTHHLMTAILQGEQEKEAVLRRLRQLIEVTILLYFDETMREIKDLTGCEAAQVRPERNGDVYELSLQFPPADAPPGLRKFLDERQHLLDRVENAITSDAKHWKAVRGSLQQLLTGRYNLGMRAWERLSDIVIALEALDCNSEIYTGNVKHFDVVCEAIELPLKPESLADA